MGGVFSAPKPPPQPAEDPSLKEQIDLQKRERDRTKAANDARIRNLRRRGQRRPLLFSGFDGVGESDGRSETLG